MPITASTLRSNIYKLLDQVLETGNPIEIERKGKKLQIVPVKKPDKLSRLVPHKCMIGNPDDIVHIDWSGEWKNDLP